MSATANGPDAWLCATLGIPNKQFPTRNPSQRGRLNGISGHPHVNLLGAAVVQLSLFPMVVGFTSAPVPRCSVRGLQAWDR